ncbi:Pre-mRNA-splicing factor sap61 [Coniosporium apollinis]|uniref:Pre-mRNA-splicing factor sap61 n=2 Tax=Coniosporium TaxID=2810619 RepID=A0ABQ9NTR7_9PEZI|nr:Pre-mRNA-splicing factor sap61 [Cladosporium sp. JES 115]KAJ9664483.1 Pre-mRNA-splicing factor sap61 [Coniosporium apollinis]
MILEDQRVLHEDLERLEQAIADRILEDPKHIRDRLNRDHQISGFLSRIQDQSKRLIDIYQDKDGSRAQEIQTISTGDPFDAFYKQLHSIKDFHRRYPNEPVENLERAYKRRAPGEDGPAPSDIDNMFTGEEGYGRFFDLTIPHEDYLNLPGVKGARRLTYLQYLDTFDTFAPPQCPIRRPDKMTDAYFRYVGGLADYLESFMRRTRPLEDLDKFFASLDAEFDAAWERDEIPGWTAEAPQKSGPAAPATEGDGAGIWCPDCQKEYSNENVYKHHLSSKKHKKAAEARAASGEEASNGVSNGVASKQAAIAHRLKERAVAEREFRIRKLASAMQTERSDTRVNVERKAGMTDRERQQELAALYAETSEPAGGKRDDESDSDGEEKIYNPLKLPLAWDGKPIPFWLYKLHGLGVEFPCEICGGHVYMGRRAFDKHFNEAKHIYGLKCLGITNTRLFNEITGIEDALKLWDKLQRDKKQEKAGTENVVQMEDADGNVMPEKVYYDLLKQGLL